MKRDHISRVYTKGGIQMKQHRYKGGISTVRCQVDYIPGMMMMMMMKNEKGSHYHHALLVM